MKLNTKKIIIAVIFATIAQVVAQETIVAKINHKDPKITSTTLELAVARTNEELKKGLMFVKKLAKNKGMLFVYPKHRQPRIWMKNTEIPLDIIFLSNDKRVTCIHKNAIPFDTKNIIKCNKKSSYVIEVNAGTIERLNIKPKDKFDFDITPDKDSSINNN